MVTSARVVPFSKLFLLLPQNTSSRRRHSIDPLYELLVQMQRKHVDYTILRIVNKCQQLASNSGFPSSLNPWMVDSDRNTSQGSCNPHLPVPSIVIMSESNIRISFIRNILIAMQARKKVRV